MDDSCPDDAPPTPGQLPATVPTRSRHDGWTPERQHDFIAALAESGCVAEACKSVGKSSASAYKLRARPDASVFRQAWDVALDYAVRRLSDAAFARAMHGVAVPVFYQGEQVGERRHYDERLTMFLLRYRDPVRYGAWLDGMEARRHPDGAGIVLAHALNAVLDAHYGIAPDANGDDGGGDATDAAGRPLPPRALADGPPPAPPRPDDDDGLTPEQAHCRALLRACDDRIQAQAEDPVQADWQSPLPVRRPRVRML